MSISKIRVELEKHELDGVIITSKQNRRYISRFTGSDGIILITLNGAFLFVDGRYTIQAGLETDGFEIIEFKESPFKLLSEFSLKNLGFEDKMLSFSNYKSLKEALPNTALHSCSWLFTELRIIKTDDELNKIKKAAKVSDLAFSHILNFAKQGMTEIEVAVELEFFMRKNGAEGVSFDTIVASGERSALPHGEPTDRKIRLGDILLMDFGCIVDGYCSDMTRTVAIGEISEEKRNIYETVKKAQQTGLDAIKNGQACKGVDGLAREVIENSGYGTSFTHALGHGVGMEVHEEPRLSPKATETLKTGMVVTVEPGIYIRDLCGVRIEDLVCVTEKGYTNFTSSTKELIIL